MGWIGVDLDGTLAQYSGWDGTGGIGDPIPVMVDRVKDWIRRGIEVRIFTARVYYPLGDELRAEESRVMARKIRAWTLEHIGKELRVTCQKDYGMIELWDDRCIQVVANTGALVVDMAAALSNIGHEDEK